LHPSYKHKIKALLTPIRVFSRESRREGSVDTTRRMRYISWRMTAAKDNSAKGLKGKTSRGFS